MKLTAARWRLWLNEPQSAWIIGEDSRRARKNVYGSLRYYGFDEGKATEVA